MTEHTAVLLVPQVGAQHDAALEASYRREGTVVRRRPGAVQRPDLADISDVDAVRSLAASGQRLEPWPDSVPALDRIASRFPVVGLSNASHSALTRISAHAGLRWHQVLSAEDAHSYRPHPDVYRLAITNAGCAPDRLLMVAAHAWDLRGARAVGMRTAHVERPVGDPPSAMDSFDVHAKSLDDLAMSLNAT